MSVSIVGSRRRSRLRSGRLCRLATFMCPTPLAAVVCALVCWGAPVALVAVHMQRSPSFSIEDEESHFDYVQRMALGSMPRLGQQLLPSTNQLLRCGVGRPPEAFTVPPCHASRSVLNRFYHSVNNAQYEAQQPPIYYVATAVLRWPFIHILGMSALPGTRITGAVWLAVGLMTVWLAAVLLGVEWPLAAAAALFIASAPNVVLASSIVNNDASAVLTGGLVAVFAAIAWRMPRRIPWWIFLLVGLVVVGLKTTALLPVITVMLLLAIDAWFARQDGGASRRPVREWLARWLPSGGAMLLGAGVTTVGWSLGLHAFSLVDVSHFVPIQLAGDINTSVVPLGGAALSMLQPLTQTPAPDFQWMVTGAVPSTPWESTVMGINAEVISLLATGAGLSWLFVKRTWAHWLGVTSLLTLFLGGWAIGISIMITYRFDTSLPGRYGLPSAVLLVLALLGALRGRAAKWMFAGVSLATFALTFWYMLV